MDRRSFIKIRKNIGRTNRPYLVDKVLCTIARSVLRSADIGFPFLPLSHCREHDELRYSIRSLFKYFNKGFSQVRILSSDLYNGKKLIAQVPSWLDLDAGRLNRVSMLFTSEIYGKLKSALPLFNSLALESQFGNVPSSGPENDVMVYFNDDMFLGDEHTVSDFWN